MTAKATSATQKAEENRKAEETQKYAQKTMRHTDGMRNTLKVNG